MARKFINIEGVKIRARSSQCHFATASDNGDKQSKQSCAMTCLIEQDYAQEKASA